MKTPLFQTTCIIFLQLAVVGLLLFSSCDGDEVTGPAEGHGVEEIVIDPSSAEFSVGEQQEFKAILLTGDGDTVDPSELEGFNIEWEWWSSDPDVFTVDQEGAEGIANGQDPGEAYCIIEVTIMEGNLNFTGRDSAFVMIF